MTELMIAKGLKIGFSHEGGKTQVVHGVDFTINSGEVVALVGESGSGKSVTALSTVGLLPLSAQVSGSVRFQNQELVGLNERGISAVRGNDISLIFQEPMTSLNPLHTIEKQLSEAIELHQSLRGADVRRAVVDLLERVGIPNPTDRLGAYPHQLSGGQRQRVMIAMALANRPKLLIADEPTTALDVTIQAQILDLLEDLKRETEMSMLFITHDLGVVRKIADRVYVMKDGEIVEHGPTAEIMQRPKHPYTQHLLSAHNQAERDVLEDTAPVLLQTEQVKVWFPIQRGLLKRTVGHVKAVNSATLRVRQGETLGIVGESGSGKSTLAQAVMRLIGSEGGIKFDGIDITVLKTRDLRKLRKDMQIVFQDPFGSLSPRMNCAQIIAEGLEVHGVPQGRTADDMVVEIMQEVGLDPEWRHRYPHEFSGGQRQRIAIARAMVLRPKLVVLDEPTSALDRTVQVQIVELLKMLQDKYGIAYLFISHDLTVVRAMSHKVLVMKDGEIVEAGTARDVFERPQTEYAKSLLAAALL